MKRVLFVFGVIFLLSSTVQSYPFVALYYSDSINLSPNERLLIVVDVPDNYSTSWEFPHLRLEVIYKLLYTDKNFSTTDLQVHYIDYRAYGLNNKNIYEKDESFFWDNSPYNGASHDGGNITVALPEDVLFGGNASRYASFVLVNHNFKTSLNISFGVINVENRVTSYVLASPAPVPTVPILITTFLLVVILGRRRKS